MKTQIVVYVEGGIVQTVTSNNLDALITVIDVDRDSDDEVIFTRNNEGPDGTFTSLDDEVKRLTK